MKKINLLIILSFLICMLPSKALAAADFASNPKKFILNESVTFNNNSDSYYDDWTTWYVNDVQKVDQTGKVNYTTSFNAYQDYDIKLKAWHYIGLGLWSWDYKTATHHVYHNKYPVVLVHGFAGWGRDEVSLNLGGGKSSGIRYWGSKGIGGNDVEADLNAKGFEIYTASVGPVTSAWDRATELHAEITGYNVSGNIDYGAEHAAASSGSAIKKGDSTPTTFTHSRYANSQFLNNSNIDSSTKRLKNTNGHVIPAVSTSNPIHLLTHSYGGLTARTFAYLMAHGTGTGTPFAAETNTPNPLFTGGKSGAVRSITTVATPNNGTNLTYVVSDILNTAGDFGINIIKSLTQETVTNALGLVYNLDVAQWQPAGVEDAFITFAAPPTPCSPAVSLKDLSLWDLSPCAEINNYAAAESNIYYFSVAAEQTYKACFDTSDSANWYAEYVPPWTCVWPGTNSDTYHYGWMTDIFVYQTDQMGSTAQTTAKGLTNEWRENDGVVNTVSEYKASCDQFITSQQGGPTANHPKATTDKTPALGKWVNVALLHKDHMDCVGGVDVFDVYGQEKFAIDWDADGDTDENLYMNDFYEKHINTLWDLPKF